MKNKNPLYVVKGKDVQEAKGIFDLVIQKMSLEPVIEFVQNILKMLLENIKTYPTFLAMKNLLDELVVRYIAIIQKFGLA